MKKQKIKFYSIFMATVVFIISIYLEFQQTPNFVTNFIQKQLIEQGYKLQFKSCYLRLWGKSEINNFKISSDIIDLTGKELKINFSLTNYFFSKPLIKNIYGKNISINIKSQKKNKAIPLIPNANFKGYINNGSIVINKLNFTHFNTFFDINGSIPLTINLKNNNNNSKSNLAEAWQFITNKINTLQKRLNFHNKKINYTIDLDSPNHIIKNSITIPRFSHNGNHCEKIILEFSYFSQTHIIDINKILVQLNNNEKIYGSVIINTKLAEISSKLIIESSPQSILSLISKNLSQSINPYLPKISPNQPPFIILNLNKAPIKTPQKWLINGNISANNFFINKLNVEKSKCNILLNIDKKTITLRDMSLKTSKLQGTFDLSLDFHNKTILLKTKGQGDPRLFSNFIWDNPQLQKKLISIWDKFKWENNNLPHFEMIMINTFKNSNQIQEPNIITPNRTINNNSGTHQFKTFLNGKFTIKDFQYKKQPIKSASANFYVSYPQFISLSNLTVNSGEGTLNNGAFTIENDSETISFTSSAPLSFLNNVSAHPIKLPSVIEYISNPSIELHQTTYYSQPIKNTVDAVINFPRLKILGSPTSQNIVQATLRGEKLQIDAIGLISQGRYITHYLQNINQLNASIKLNITDSDLPQLIKNYKKDSQISKKSGKLFATANLQLDYDVLKDQPVNINGKANAKIIDGSFLEIPGLPNIKSFAKITEVTAPLIIFKDQQIIFSENNPITTNGTILAISTHGLYDWNTRQLNFNLRTRILKDIKIFILLGYVMHLKITGDIANPKINAFAGSQ